MGKRYDKQIHKVLSMVKNAVKKINQGRGIGSGTGEREEVGILNRVARKVFPGASLAVQCLRLSASTARGTGSIPGQGAKIPHATWRSQKSK